MKKINKSQIMKRAWNMYKEANCNSKAEFSLALKFAWKEYRQQQQQQTNNVVIATFADYNHRRYGRPWVAIQGADGRLDFQNKVGAYYNNDYSAGSGGELIITAPIEDQIYAYGQKDYSGKNTLVEYMVFSDGEFVYCDRFGKIA